MKKLIFTLCLPIVLSLLFASSLKAQQPDSIEQKIKRAIHKSLNNGVRPSKLRGVKLSASSIFITLDAEASVEKVIVSESLDVVFEAREKVTDQLKIHINNLALDKTYFSNRYFIVIIIYGSMAETNVQLSKMPENWETLFKGIDINQLNEKTLKYCFPVSTSVFTIRN